MKILDDFKRKHKQGYASDEVMQIFKSLNNADKKIFFDCLNGVTTIEVDGQIFFYEIDIERAIRCSLEKRNLENLEWD